MYEYSLTFIVKELEIPADLKFDHSKHWYFCYFKVNGDDDISYLYHLRNKTFNIATHKCK